jgi:excisionase family DNA binding protein
MDNEIMNVEELAKYLSVPVSNIYTMTANKQIPFFKLPGGRLIRFTKTDIDAWVQSQKESGNELQSN